MDALGPMRDDVGAQAWPLDAACDVVAHLWPNGSLEVRLNRSRVINALSQAMITALEYVLRRAAKDDAVHAVVLVGEGSRGFCAGGDVKRLGIAAAAGDYAVCDTFFATEYSLMHNLHHFPKPCIAFLHGITFGGGVGLSQPCGFRIVTDSTRWCMPEGLIGFFPDVGASHFLAQLKPAGWGRYLALTGVTIGAQDQCWLGLATHYCPETQLPALARALVMHASPLQHAAIAKVLQRFCASVVPDSDTVPSLRSHADAVEQCFGTHISSVSHAMSVLASMDSPWARDTLTTLKHLPWITLCVSWEAQKRARHMNLSQAFAMEYQIATHFARSADFTEGIHERLVSKRRQPKWSPASQVTTATVQRYFAFWKRSTSRSIDLTLWSDMDEQECE